MRRSGAEALTEPHRRLELVAPMPDYAFSGAITLEADDAWCVMMVV